MDRTTTGKKIVDALLKAKLVAVVRTTTSRGVIDAVRALKAGGVTCMEITMTIPDAVSVIEQLNGEMPGILIGAGTVMTPQMAEDCVAAGAEFIVSPVFDTEVVARIHELGKVAIPGALTPTEVVTAWNSGADLVKIFPAACVGSKYISDLKAPLPDIRLMPTGGINAENIAEYINSGADVICVGSWLVDKKAITVGDYSALTKKAQQILAAMPQE